MDQAKIIKIVTQLIKAAPNAKSELNFSNDFQLLIAVMLSAHTTDKSVNKATQTLFKIVKNPKAMLKLGAPKLKQQIKGVGLYNNKTKNIIATCKILVDNYAGKIPDTREQLETLPGVGRKTANIILNAVFHEPTLGVDTHIFRVANRTKIAVGKTPLSVEKQLIKVLPKKLLTNLHFVLVLHGRYVCTAKKPLCKKCVIKDWCEYKYKNLL